VYVKAELDAAHDLGGPLHLHVLHLVVGDQGELEGVHGLVVPVLEEEVESGRVELGRLPEVLELLPQHVRLPVPRTYQLLTVRGVDEVDGRDGRTALSKTLAMASWVLSSPMRSDTFL
jgi:hypothetical protein